MLTRNLRRLALVGAVAGAFAATSAGIASAASTDATQTYTSCSPPAEGGFNAKICVNVRATALAGGGYRVSDITATAAQLSFDPSDTYFHFGLGTYNELTKQGGVIEDDTVAVSGGTSVTHRFKLSDVYIGPGNSSPSAYFRKFAGTIRVDVTLEYGGYDRADLGEAQSNLA